MTHVAENAKEQEQKAAAPATAAEGKPAKSPKKTAEEKAADKAAKKAAADKAKAETEAAKPAKDTKNGVTRPSTGVTKLVWDTADKLSSDLKAAVERAALVKALEGKVEVGTIHTQYGRWRKYYGLTETKEARQARLKVIRDRKDAEKKDKADKKAEAAKVKAETEAAAAAEKAKQPEQAAA